MLTRRSALKMGALGLVAPIGAAPIAAPAAASQTDPRNDAPLSFDLCSLLANLDEGGRRLDGFEHAQASFVFHPDGSFDVTPLAVVAGRPDFAKGPTIHAPAEWSARDLVDFLRLIPQLLAETVGTAAVDGEVTP